MKTVYLYLINTLADWEIGLLTSEINSRRFFKNDAPVIDLKCVAPSLSPITTMGGIPITPNCLLESMKLDEDTILILPGAETWNDSIHADVLKISRDLLDMGGTVAAICGATAALADTGLFDDLPHTSNGPGFLEMVSQNYKGSAFYKDCPSVSDQHLITASSATSLEWTRDVLESLDVYHKDTLEYWYDYFKNGSVDSYFNLMNTLD